MTLGILDIHCFTGIWKCKCLVVCHGHLMHCVRHILHCCGMMYSVHVGYVVCTFRAVCSNETDDGAR